MYVRRFPASSTEIEDLKKEIEDLRELVLMLAEGYPSIRNTFGKLFRKLTGSQSQTNESNDD